MYTKDKNHRVTVRFNDEQFAFIVRYAETLDVSPSDFIRMIINTGMATTKKQGDPFDISKEGAGRENDKADSNDLV